MCGRPVGHPDTHGDHYRNVKSKCGVQRPSFSSPMFDIEARRRGLHGGFAPAPDTLLAANKCEIYESPLVDITFSPIFLQNFAWWLCL